MSYFIKAPDHADALSRRMEARESHLKGLEVYRQAGKVLYAAALLNEKGEPCGTAMIVNMTPQEIEDMLKSEPYIANNVWDQDKMEIVPCRPAPGF